MCVCMCVCVCENEKKMITISSTATTTSTTTKTSTTTTTTTTELPSVKQSLKGDGRHSSMMSKPWRNIPFSLVCVCVSVSVCTTHSSEEQVLNDAQLKLLALSQVAGKSRVSN